MEFDGYVGMPASSIYDRRFLNKVFIDQNLSMPANKEKYQKVRFQGLLCAQQALALRSTSDLRHIENEGQALTNRLPLQRLDIKRF